MYTADQLSKMIFFDVETTTRYATLKDLKKNEPKMAELWEKRCDYLRKRFEENAEMSNDELYLEKAALHPEFNKIVCASFGRVSFKDDHVTGITPSATIKSYSSENEKEVLQGIHKVFSNFKTFTFTGHTIKRFDIPVICKRMLINEMSLPPLLLVHNMKPWEMPFVDIAEIWSFGAWQEGFTSLELLSTSLGLDTPKDDIRGEDVSRVFWVEKNLPRIVTYCQKDVLATANVLLKLSGHPVVEEFELQS